jgi:hypothetical protein
MTVDEAHSPRLKRKRWPIKITSVAILRLD